VQLRLQDVIAFLSVRLHFPIVHPRSASNLALYQTCSSHRKLRDSKYLWISVLEQTQKRRSLACPVGTDVSKLDIEDLQRIAICTYPLERNWSQDKPRISRAVKVVPWLPGLTGPQAKFELLAAIPGTTFVVLFSSKLTDIIICDTDGSVPTSTIYVGWKHEHCHFDEQAGRQLIAVVSSDPDSPGCVAFYFPITNIADERSSSTNSYLRVLSIDYAPKSIPVIKQVFHCFLDNDADMRCQTLFIYQNVVGILPAPNEADGPPRPIRIVNFEKNTSLIFLEIWFRQVFQPICSVSVTTDMFRTPITYSALSSTVDLAS